MELSNVFRMEDELPVVNKEYRNIKSIYDLIRSDYGEIRKDKNDISVRVKIKSRKELAFAYFYLNGDYDSNPNKIEIIRDKVGLDKDWTISDKLQLVIDELTEDCIKDRYDKLLELSIKTANTYINLLTEIYNNSEKAIEELKRGIDLLDETQIKQRSEIIKGIRTEFKEMNGMSKDLNDMIKNYDDLIAKRKERDLMDGKKSSKREDRLQTDMSIYSRK